MEFKQLEIKTKHGPFKRLLHSRHVRKTMLFILIGAAGGFVLYYISEGMHYNSIPFADVLKSALIGGFFGFFLTNSPCARNRCQF